MAYKAFLALSVALLAGNVACQNTKDIFAAIDAEDDGLAKLNKEIWETPELKYQEKHAHKVLTDYLEDQGFKVTRGAYNLSTAFVAEFSSGKGRTVSFNSEYDALTGMGHACGHNLIATVGVAAAIGVKEALQNQGVEGKVILFGTPAEEGGSGKIKLLDAGAYDDVDCSLMAHPAGYSYTAFYTSSAAWTANVTFTGQPAHAAGSPWAGRNALDGFVSAYTMTGLLRQQMQPDDRVHHVVHDESQVLNVIPESASSVWGVRSNTIARRDALLDQILTIIDSAAAGSNTSVKVDPLVDYFDVKSNWPLAKAYYNHFMENFDPSKSNSTSQYKVITPEESRENPSPGGSTDQGNVSYKLPAIHVTFPISTKDGPHTPGFRVSAGTESAYKQAIRTAKALALVGVDVLVDDDLAREMKEYFEDERPK